MKEPLVSVLIPVYPELPIEQLDYIVRTLNAF